ncbi:hypothetical protein Mapa_004864 [Marchantia paleacea]|nr:hypothetical protein Mapa_004864 [Marchantia paleacea]
MLNTKETETYNYTSYGHLRYWLSCFTVGPRMDKRNDARTMIRILNMKETQRLPLLQISVLSMRSIIKAMNDILPTAVRPQTRSYQNSSADDILE